MIHYDNEINATTYFRKELVGVINKVFKRKWEEVGTLKVLFNLAVNRMDSWSYSEMLFILSYLIMLGVGLLGIYVPIDLWIILLPILVWFADRSLFLNVLTHGVALGLLVAISPNLYFMGAFIAIFIIGRLFIDLPHLQRIRRFKYMYDNVGLIYSYGYERPMEADDILVGCVRFLNDTYKLHEGNILSAYILGHYLSEDEVHEPQDVADYILGLVREGASD